jgi:hypothetical protein
MCSLKDLNLGWEIVMTLYMLGIDIAKSPFQLHGADSAGKGILKKRLPRHKLAAYIAKLIPIPMTYLRRYKYEPPL